MNSRLIFLLLLNTILFNLSYAQDFRFNLLLPDTDPAPIIADFNPLNYGEVAFGDLNGDGFVDFVENGADKYLISPFYAESTAIVYLSDSTKNYPADLSFELDGVFFATLKLIDADSDGDLDIYSSGYTDTFQTKSFLYINDGHANFTIKENFPISNKVFTIIDFADIDLDGDIDFVVQNSNSPVNTSLYLNDGNANFTEEQSFAVTDLSGGTVEFIDVNGDNYEDLLVYGKDDSSINISILYINDQSGQFSEAPELPFSSHFIKELAANDVDNDGDIDIVFSGSDPSYAETTKMYLNDGNGNFTLSTTNSFPDINGLALSLFDADNDGDKDLFLSHEDYSGLYVNDGSGVFTEASSQADYIKEENTTIAPVDIDLDGDLDLFLSGGSYTMVQNGLYINNGSGEFTENKLSPLIGFRNGNTDMADVDGDGDIDVIIAGRKARDNEKTKLYLNDGTGQFQIDNLNGFKSTRHNGDLRFMDLDNDNDQDLIITGIYLNSEDFSMVYLNDGNGLFTEHQEIHGALRSSLDFADVDSDGDIDFLLTGDNLSLDFIATLYINDGAANFTEKTGLPFIGVENGTGSFADIDGDGDSDVLITGDPEPGPVQKSFYINDGLGNFTFQEDENPLLGVFKSTTTFEDFDNDGDLDLFLTGLTVGGSGWRPHAVLYTNDGLGNYSESENDQFVGVGAASVVAKDLDGDSDIDLLVMGQTTYGGERTVNIYVNDGTGIFSNNPLPDVTAVSYGRIFFENIDGDNKPDILVSGNYKNGRIGLARIYSNQSCFFSPTDTAIVSCDNFEFNGNLLTSSGYYEAILPGSNNCDSLVRLDLTINHSSDTLITITECDSFVLNGTVYEESGEYSQLLTNSVGCDSTINLDLTILSSTFNTLDIEECDTIFVNGETFTSSGIYEQIITNTVGCDSTLTLNLTIPKSTSQTINEEACGSFEMNGYYYDASGTYEQHLTNTAGCDSLMTLNLTLKEPSFDTLEIETCDSYNFNGEILTQSCEFSQLFTNTVGCDSTITLHLTILESTEETLDVESCDSYNINGETFDESGVYIQNLTNIAGCDSTLTINLELGKSTQEILNIEACESYELYGERYDESGSFEIITNNSFGCEHHTTLNLTILKETEENLEVTACDSYTLNGEIYSQSGIYKQNLANIAGCDSTITLNLEIQESTSNTIYASSCDQYELNGEIYNTNGIYVQKLTNEVGCDSTLTLNLEINPIDIGVSLDDRTFTANVLNADRYQWIDCLTNEPISGANTNSYKTRVSGEFAVEIIKDGCIDTSACQQIIVTSLAENNFSKSINIFPNPAKEKVQLIFSEIHESVEVTIYAISGQRVSSNIFSHSQQIEIPISEAHKGLLLLNIKTSDGKVGIIKIQKE